MDQNTASKRGHIKNNLVINVGAANNVKLQAYKKSVVDKAMQEIDKIEEDIKNLEQNKI